jgi:hypothetical protein
MQAKITQSFLAALSLIGVLTLPSPASAHDDDYSDNRGAVRREHGQLSYADREDLYLRRFPRQNPHRHGRWDNTYHKSYSGNPWYGGPPEYDNKHSRGDGCKWPRRAHENERQYRPRYYGNDDYGYAR